MTGSDFLEQLGSVASQAKRAAVWAAGALGTCVERAIAPRTLMSVLLVTGALLSLSGWLRPPMSTDLSATAIPLGLGAGGTLGADTIPTASHTTRMVSIGTLLLSVIVVGFWVVAARQEWFAVICGVLFSLSIAGNAVAAWNHPTLIESLESELEQARRIRKALGDGYENSLSQQGLYARNLEAPVDDARRADLTVGFKYLQYGVWLMILAAAGILCATQGGVARRLGLVGIWGLLGMAVALSLCQRRLRGEYWWHQAVQFEQRGDFAAARKSAERAVRMVPEFEDLHRTWFLLGRLDYRDDETTPARRYFRIYQLALTNETSAALHEIDSLTKHASGPLQLLLNRLAGRLLGDQGLRDYRARRYASAATKYRRALEMSRKRLDSPFLLAVAHASTDQPEPERAKRYLQPLLPRLRDRALKAEIWSTVGDAYFESSQFKLARGCYRESLREFQLPKTINHRALKGLVGM